MAGFWADGFWADGFWADGFWQEDAAAGVRFGIEPVPRDANDDEAFDQADYTRAVQMVDAIGADNVSFSVDWDEFETSEGVYSTTRLGWINDARGSKKFQVSLNAVNYLGELCLPAYLTGLALNHATVTAAYAAAWDAIYDVVGSDGMDIAVVATEAATRLDVVTAERATLAGLVTAAETHITGKSGWSAVKVTVSFTHSRIAVAGFTTDYAAILAAVTLPAATYYPINADFTVQYENVGTLFDGIDDDLLALTTTLGTTVILTEVGFPSHPALNSSEALQALFYGYIVGAIETNGDIYAADFQWLTEFPRWFKDILGIEAESGMDYFVGTLGLTDSEATPKPALAALMADLNGDNSITISGTATQYAGWQPVANTL